MKKKLVKLCLILYDTLSTASIFELLRKQQKAKITTSQNGRIDSKMQAIGIFVGFHAISDLIKAHTQTHTHTFNVSCICTHLFYVVGNQDRIWRVLLVPVAVVFYTDAMMVQHQMLSIHPMNSLQHPYTKYIGKIR